MKKQVLITYRLKKTSTVSFLDQGFSIGDQVIALKNDQDDDPDSFSTKGKQAYSCLMEAGGLQLSLYAEGKTGDYWILEIQADGKEMADSPIKVRTDKRGHLDFDQYIH